MNPGRPAKTALGAPTPALRPSARRSALDRSGSHANLRAMTPSAPLAAAARGHWDRSQLVPTRRQLAATLTLAVLGAIGLNTVTLNPFIEVLGEAIFVSIVLLLGFKLAGAWRQTVLPRWVAQLL